jgi:hypothetical protein
MDATDISMGYLVAQALTPTPTRNYDEAVVHYTDLQKEAIRSGKPIITAVQIPPIPAWPERQVRKEI